MQARVSGHQILGPTATQNQSAWHQCPDETFVESVDTRSYVLTHGSLTLELGATNAAGVVSSPSETLQVDNDPVQLTLSGPTQASTTAGTQYVTAFATAGPSGVAIGCSLDSGPTQWQNASSAQIPVSGAGQHLVSCQAHNEIVRAHV